MTRTLLSLAAFVGLATAVPVSAEYIVNVQEVGPNVIATGSGSFDLTALSFVSLGLLPASIYGNIGQMAFGNASQAVYKGFTGPSSFATGASGLTFADTTSGPAVALVAATGYFYLPSAYVSGTTLAASTDVFNNRSFASLGLVSGSYVYTWGSGATADRFVLNIGNPVAGVPEPASWAMMIAGFGAIGGALRHTRRRQPQARFVGA